MYKCEFCGKEYKTERGLGTHLEKCEEYLDLKKLVDEERIDIQEDAPESLDMKLMEFFKGATLDNISLNGEKLMYFKELYKDYFQRDLKKTCANGLVHAYCSLYYTTKKIKENYDKAN